MGPQYDKKKKRQFSYSDKYEKIDTILLCHAFNEFLNKESWKKKVNGIHIKEENKINLIKGNNYLCNTRFKVSILNNSN